jgi:CHASE2 domain-containing sensor protein
MNEDTEGTRGAAEATTVLSRVLHRLRVTFALSVDADAEAIRAVTLATLVAVTFAVLGIVQHDRASEWLAESPFNPDVALRALSRGWFESRRTVPLTLVEIDEATYRGWGSPPATPRDALVRLLQVVAAANPAGIVVDIDLSGGAIDGTADAGSRALHEFLAAYSGTAPLILPKRVETRPDGTLVAEESPFDDVVAKNPRLAWAHARFESAGGGVVRTWQPWLAICTPAGLRWLPAVPVSLAATMTTPVAGLEHRAAPADAFGACLAAHEVSGPVQRVLVGPRITGDGAVVRRDARSVSASLLLDPQIARDDSQLFAHRVVFIGATHAAASDEWLTPGAVLPGVELLASIVRYAPLQGESRGALANLGYRAVALLLFALFVAAEWRWRGFGAVVVITGGVLAVVAVLLALFDSLVVFEALEAAILLSISYKAFTAIFKSVEAFKARRPRFPPGPLGWVRALAAHWRREHHGASQGE